MKLGFVVALLASIAVGNAETTNPLGKVLDLMGKLSEKLEADGEAADKAYNEFVEWCDDTDKNTRYEIKTTKASKEKLESFIAKMTSDIEVATSKVSDLAGSIAEAEQELTGATAGRKAEAAQFAEADAELVDVVSTLGRSIDVLERETAKNPAAFAQIDTSNVHKMLDGISAVIDAAAFSASDRGKLMAFVQSTSDDDSEDDDSGAPAPDAYKSHSGGIVDVLEEMRDKAESQLSELRAAESKAKHSFKMLKQHREREISAETKDMSEQKSRKAAAEEQKGVDEGDLGLATKQLAAAEETLENLHEECIGLAADHEKSVAARKDELAVIGKAKKMLEDSTSSAAEKTYSFLQASSRKQKSVKITSLVKRLAKEQHSAALAQLASRIGAVMQYSQGADVFAKVKGLIGDMIAKLEQAASAEAQEKAYCDQELAKTEAKKSDLEDAMESLTTKMDQASSKSVELKGEVKKLQAELAALAKSQVEMDKIRAEENAKYIETKTDLETGMAGVQDALQVLREYYGNDAALIQNDSIFGSFMQQPAKPEMHREASGAGGSIIGILELVEGDFATNLAKVETEEADAAEDYEKTTQENKITKAAKDKDVTFKTAEFTALDESLAEFRGDRDTAATELVAVNEYYAALKGRCLAKPGTYEERAKRRGAEVSGLKQALSVLEEETSDFMQQGSLRIRRA